MEGRGPISDKIHLTYVVDYNVYVYIIININIYIYTHIYINIHILNPIHPILSPSISMSIPCILVNGGQKITTIIMIVVPRITATIIIVGIVIKQLITNRRKFRSQTSDNVDR